MLPKELSVLFVGNSFTARNNVPALIAELAQSRGHRLDHRLISMGGASLKMHWNKGVAQEAMKSTKYDYVVLQEQSTLPVKGPARMHESVRLFDEEIRGSGAKTVLYLTWARQYAPEAQNAITAAYKSIGSELGAIVVPAGIAWEAFLKNHKSPVLHDKDGSHPTLAGSYLAACVFLAVLFGENPVGIETELKGLSADEREALQRVAWETVAN
jgi:hypothetical protein